MKPYDPSKIESKWQKAWARKKIYRTSDPSARRGEAGEKAADKFYILDMFPYPSGEGLHVGHPKGYIATDTISRMKRMQGKTVLHPMGFDAFGLPAENYALKTKTNPQIAVKKNVARYKKQLEILGLDYDWSREVNTTDPKFYRWTQWIFLQLLKKGLAYESFEPINWCPSCKTGLANEDIEDGRCERCGTPVEKKPLRQWVLRITDYADRLLADLDADDYVMPKLVDETNPHQPGKPIVRRAVAHAIVFDPKAQKYLIIRNKKHGWDTVVIGGIEGSESPEETARREVREETGYTDLEFKRILGGPTEAHYYTKHKGENRIATARAAYFELKSHAKTALADGEDADNEILWVGAEDFVPGKMVNSELPIWLERLKDPSKGWPKKLLDWPASIKESQRNWIGRSEGALLEFEVRNAKSEKKAAPAVSPARHIEVYTTRPDTLFGVTYVVLAPEHKLVAELAAGASNKTQIEAYVTIARATPEMERADAKKEKTGVELKGVKAVNPANGQEIPVWIADYVLADYGTGAVMAVPAHDERDWAFAQKFGLPIKEAVVPDFVDATAGGAPRADKKTSNRKSVTVLVKHWSEDKYILLEWKKTPRTTFITGGIEEGEDPVSASAREIREETGYTDAAFVEHLGQAYGHFYASWKEENHQTHIDGLLFKLKSGARETVAADELAKHEPVWVAAKDVEQALKKTEHDIRFSLYFWANASGRGAYVDEGKLVDSGAFSGQDSSAAKKAVAESVGGRWTTKYKLRDWVFSRQRYWGEPIPVVHCERCAFARYGKEAKLSLNFYYEPVWKALASGAKTLETRALNPEEEDRYFGDIEFGDILHFCHRDKETKKLKGDRLFRVTSIKTYRSFGELFADKEALIKLAKEDYASVEELEASYAAYGPEYVAKIKKNGLIAWGIEPVTVSVPVPEKELPILLPKVKSYEPTGTGESPLAAISKWVNTECPACLAEKDAPKYFIFDFDGVLGDTWEAAIQGRMEMGDAADREEAIKKFSVYFNQKPHHTKDIPRNDQKILKDNAYVDKLGAAMARIGFDLFDGFIAEVKKIKNAKFAVVSSGSAKYAKPALKKADIKFSHVLTYEDHHSKQEKIERICADWKADIKDVYYFTDTKADVYELEDSLDRSKIIGCAWGYLGFDALKEALPERQILRDFKDVRRLFDISCAAKRETNTMPQWAGSSWYYLRYMDPGNRAALVDPKKERRWSPVDLYVGGAEHATRHLIYARFWHKFLYDIGAVSSIEPFAKLQSVGLIMGEDGRKMSKRFGNVVNPDEIVKAFGADTLRVYEMFMGPFDQQIAWSTAGMIGSRRFIERVWKLADKVPAAKAPKGKEAPGNAASASGSKAADKIIHKTIKKVGEDVADMKFNTAVSALMIAANELEKAPALSRAQFEALIKLLAPFAPHVSEELWASLGNKKSVHLSAWPAYDPALAAADETTVIVQVGGKVRGSFSAPAGAAKEALESAAKAVPAVAKWLEGKRIAKTIVVPGRLVNFVLAE